MRCELNMCHSVLSAVVLVLAHCQGLSMRIVVMSGVASVVFLVFCCRVCLCSQSNVARGGVNLGVAWCCHYASHCVDCFCACHTCCGAPVVCCHVGPPAGRTCCVYAWYCHCVRVTNCFAWKCSLSVVFVERQCALNMWVWKPIAAWTSFARRLYP